MEKFIDVALEELNKNPNYAQPWIIFDRDQVPNFDEIIECAEKKEIRVGWTNPCIEIWFFAYFGEVPVINESRQCCSKFGELFKNKFKYEYNKADRQIFEKLNNQGDLKQAIRIAESRYKQYIRAEPNKLPSAMISCGTIYQIVKEINNKIFNVV